MKTVLTTAFLITTFALPLLAEEAKQALIVEAPAVGGLMREDVQTVQVKVPILGDIPLIGRLFQSQAENRIKSNLIISVIAQIIDANGRPLRGGDAGGVVPVKPPVGEFDGGVLPVPLDLPE